MTTLTTTKFKHLILFIALVFIINSSEASERATLNPKLYKYIAALYNPLTNERTLIDLGNQLVKAKEYEFALEMFDKAIDKNPTETSYYDYRAICYSKMGPKYVDMAWSEIKKTMDSGKKSSILNAVAFEDLGMKLYEAKKFSEAHQCYSEAILCDICSEDEKEELPTGSYYLMRGICSLMLENFEEAKKDLKGATQLLDPSSSKEDQIHLRKALHEFGRWEEVMEKFLVILDNGELENLGKKFQDSKKFNEAIHCYTEGIKRDSENMDLFQKRAESYLGMGNLDSAVQDLKTRLGRDPHSIDYWYNLIEIMFSREKFEEAINEIQVLDESEIGWLARKFLVAEKYEDALRIYDEIVRKYSSNPKSYTARAECHYKMENYNKEIVDYKSAVGLDPKMRSSYVQLLISYKLFEDALKEANFLEEPKELLKAGEEFFEYDKLNEAIDCYTKAIVKNPENFKFYYRRGICYFKLKNFDEAISNFEEARAKSSDDLWSRLYLSEALIEVGKYNKAEKVFKEVTSRGKIPSISSDHKYYVQRKLINTKPRDQRQKTLLDERQKAVNQQMNKEIEGLLSEVYTP